MIILNLNIGRIVYKYWIIIKFKFNLKFETSIFNTKQFKLMKYIQFY